MLNAGFLPRAYVHQARVSFDAGVRYHVLHAQLRDQVPLVHSWGGDEPIESPPHPVVFVMYMRLWTANAFEL